MIVVCPSCQARYKFDESRLGDRPKAKTRCAKCGGTIEIENPAMTRAPAPAEAAAGGGAARGGEAEPDGPGAFSPGPAGRASGSSDSRVSDDTTRRSRTVAPTVADSTVTGRDLHRMGILELPKDKRFSLAVIQGAATGQIFQIAKTRTVIGRTGADINLDDPEASRQHAVVEILGETAILRDLDSTNGTFMELDRIQQQILSNQMEFRIGSHILMFIVTDVE